MPEFTLDDGRKAEKLESNLDPVTKVTEIYVEPKLEKKLSQRITERLCVCEREIETIDESTGQVVTRSIEKICGGSVSSEEQKLSLKSPMQALVEEKIKKPRLKNYIFAAVILAQLLVLAYVIFVM